MSASGMLLLVKQKQRDNVQCHVCKNGLIKPDAVVINASNQQIDRE